MIGNPTERRQQSRERAQSSLARSPPQRSRDMLKTRSTVCSVMPAVSMLVRCSRCHVARWANGSAGVAEIAKSDDEPERRDEQVRATAATTPPPAASNDAPHNREQIRAPRAAATACASVARPAATAARPCCTGATIMTSTYSTSHIVCGVRANEGSSKRQPCNARTGGRSDAGADELTDREDAAGQLRPRKSDRANHRPAARWNEPALGRTRREPERQRRRRRAGQMHPQQRGKDDRTRSARLRGGGPLHQAQRAPRSCERSRTDRQQRNEDGQDDEDSANGEDAARAASPPNESSTSLMQGAAASRSSQKSMRNGSRTRARKRL